MKPSPETFARDILGMNEETTTNATMLRVVVEAINRWEAYREEKEHDEPFRRAAQGGVENQGVRSPL